MDGDTATTMNHFTKNISGHMPESPEENLWSWAYLTPEKNLPGEKLSWVQFPDMQGNDMYLIYSPRIESKFIFSGRNVLQIHERMTRHEMEDLVRLERRQNIDESSITGWTIGSDGSEYLLQNPKASHDEVIKYVQSKDATQTTSRFGGILESVPIQHGDLNCSSPRWVETEYRLCHGSHNLHHSEHSLLRASVVRFKEHEPGYVMRRLEIDHRPRGYNRFLLKHHQRSKRWQGYFPPFDITDELIMVMGEHTVEVFKMGNDREINIFEMSKHK